MCRSSLACVPSVPSSFEMNDFSTLISNFTKESCRASTCRAELTSIPRNEQDTVKPTSCSPKIKYIIQYTDEAIRERQEKKLRKVVLTATNAKSELTIDETASRATLLAQKVYKYRKLREKLNGVDVNNPNTDISKCLGGQWELVP